MIDKASVISDIIVTMDAHSKFDIEHPLYWVNGSGDHPAPFSLIKSVDVGNGTWKPFRPELLNNCLK